MRIADQLCDLADIWSASTGRSAARLATIVLNRGHFFDALRRGGDCGTDTFTKFLHFFRDAANWPDGVVPPDAAALLDNFENIAVGGAQSTGKLGDLPPAARVRDRQGAAA